MMSLESIKKTFMVIPDIGTILLPDEEKSHKRGIDLDVIRDFCILPEEKEREGLKIKKPISYISMEQDERGRKVVRLTEEGVWLKHTLLRHSGGGK